MGRKHLKRLSRGVRKYIRRAKARLRREGLNLEEQKKKFEELYRSCGFNFEKKK